MATYDIAPGSRVVVRAKSRIHDTTTTWERVRGTVEADAATLVEAGATAQLVVDMAAFDAGGFLENRKLKKDMDVARYPEATFSLARLSGVTRRDDGTVSAVAEGTLRWRGREVAVRAAGSGRVDDARIEATAEFDLDVRDVGVTPPRFLMFKVEEIVAVSVTLRATRRA